MLLSVNLNGQATGDTVPVLHASDGRLMLRAQDLSRWRLRLPGQPGSMQDGELFVWLDAFAGIGWEVDETRQILSIDAGPALFKSTLLDLTSAASVRPDRISPGWYFNYDLSTARADNRTQTSAFLQLGAFNRLGAGQAGFLVRGGFADMPRLVRLETTWTRDDPEARASLRLGDTVSGSGQWALPTRLGGVQWSTNFATQPGFVRYPLPSMAGEAVLPSTVDLYVNGALQLRREVPAGPFSLQQMPVLTGQGEARLVVRDLLGREQIIVTPYFTSPSLLKAGLHDFSYEAGRVRENFGLAGRQYGRAAVVGVHRMGVTDSLTLEGRGEWVGSGQAAGLGAALALPGLGTVNASAAASRAERGMGALLGVGAEHRSGRIGLGGQMRMASHNFDQMGQQAGRLAFRRSMQTYASVSVGGGSISIGYAQQSPRDADQVRLLTVGYGVGLGAIGFLGVSLTRTGGPKAVVMASVNLTHVLDPQTSVNLGSNTQRGITQGQVQLQRSPPAGDGAGYRVAASTGEQNRVTAGTTVQHAVGRATLEADLSEGRQAWRAGAGGGLAWLDGAWFGSRFIDESFAVVEVPGMAGVRIYGDNHLLGSTREDGRMLLPRMRPYQSNPVRIDAADLPLDAQVDTLQMDAVPAFGSGLLLRFPVRRLRSGTVTVMQGNGQAVLAGAEARVHGRDAVFPFGLDGQVYLEGLEPHNRVQVHWWDGKRAVECEFEVERSPSDDPVPDLGVQVCREPSP